MVLPSDPVAMSAGLEGLIAVNTLILAGKIGGGVSVPPLYRAGVRYRNQRDPRRWGNILEVLRAGYADCKNLSAWRVAELRFYQGVPARVLCYKTGHNRWHAIVKYPDGRTEDPSVRLGMKRRYA